MQLQRPSTSLSVWSRVVSISSVFACWKKTKLNSLSLAWNSYRRRVKEKQHNWSICMLQWWTTASSLDLQCTKREFSGGHQGDWGWGTVLPHEERLEEQGLFSLERRSSLPVAFRKSLKRWSQALCRGGKMRTNGQKLTWEVQAGYKEKFYPHKDSAAAE